jgi:hypothetical protein
MISAIDVKHYKEDNWLQPKPKEQSFNWPQPDHATLMDDYLKRHPELNPKDFLPLIGKSSEETDPTGKNPHEPGAKLDSGKPSVYRGLLDYFPRACTAVAEVSSVGAKKYTWKGWETVPDGFSRYSDALARHLLAESTDGSLDKDTGLTHAAHTAWNALARLELLLKK